MPVMLTFDPVFFHLQQRITYSCFALVVFGVLATGFALAVQSAMCAIDPVGMRFCVSVYAWVCVCLANVFDFWPNSLTP
jgi:hypothetical protein